MSSTVVLTGGGGYIGSVLTRRLLDAGYNVRVVDRFFFGEHTLPADSRVETVKADVRSVPASTFQGAFAVLDLAAISNDPAGELDPVKTLDINYRGRRRTLELASDAGVSRYILASSCSVYGFQDGVLDEESSTNPLTTYAEANLRAESAAIELINRGTDMCITVFRQATVYGLSPRMRFDLAVNGMTLGLWQHGTIPVLRDGTQWRPMVHVRDTSKAFVMALKAEKSAVNGQRFNVGSNDQNYQILPLAELVAKGLGKKFEFTWYGEPDHRSYQVDFSKVRNVLGFVPDWTPDLAAEEIAKALDSGEVAPTELTKTMNWYMTLLKWNETLKQVAPDGVVL